MTAWREKVGQTILARYRVLDVVYLGGSGFGGAELMDGVVALGARVELGGVCKAIGGLSENV